MPELRWSYCLSIYAGLCGSSILCKSLTPVEEGEEVFNVLNSLDVSTTSHVGTHVKNLVSAQQFSTLAHLSAVHSQDSSQLESKPI
jgi:hypothetical protein